MRFLLLLIVLLFSQISFSQDWCQKADYPDLAVYAPMAFSLGGMGYSVVGALSNSNNSNKLWEYDPVANSWTQRANFPGTARRNGVAFTINGEAFVGCGWTGSTRLRSMYKYNPATNSWSSITNYPGNGGRGSFATSLNGKGYVGGGGSGSGINSVRRDFWEYDPISNSWSQLANFGFGNRTGGVMHAVNNRIYAGLGHDQVISYDDFWEYNPQNNSWSQVASFPGADRLNPVSFVVDNKIIVGGGYTLTALTCLSDYYEYDPTSNTWTSINGFIDGARSISAAFAINNKGYLSTGWGLNKDTIRNTWEYDPNKITVIDTTFCVGDTFVYDAFRPNASYIWYDNSSDTVKTFTTTGIYFLDYTIHGCNYSDTLKLTFNPNPIVDLGADTALCQGESLTLDATNNGATYAWQDNSTNATFTVTQAGQYWVDVTTNGCSTSDTINVSYKPLPIVSLGNDTTLCDGETLTLDATNSGATYLWQDNSTNATFTVSQADTFYVAVDLNGCIATDTIIVDYQSYPIVDLGADTALCQGESLTLDATNNGATYAWQDNSTNATFTVTQAGQYWVEVTTNGCSTSDTINVSYKPLPIVSLGNDTTLCDGETLTLDATNSGATYLWQDNSTNATFTVSQADTFYVAVDLNGCIATDTIIVDYQSYPIVDLGADTTLCQGESFTLDATNSGATYAWQDNSTNATFTVTQAGQYWVDVTTNGCSTSDTINVSYKPLPIVSLGNDTTLCDGETLTLDATNSGATYLWQDNSTNATYTVSQADTFYVAVDLNGCIATDTIIVDYQSYPIVDLGADTTLCQGESFTLDATNSGATYAWQDNSTNATFTVTQAGQYWVDVTTNGCSTSDTINVSYKPLPIVSLGNDTTLCDGETLTLDATNSGGAYLWQDNSTNATLTVSQADTFYVAVDLNGCIATDTIIVDYQSYPIVDLGADTTLCQGESLTLDATNSGETYAWQDNSTNATFTVNQAGQYWVDVTTNGCSTSDTINVSYKPLPTVNLGNDTTLCDGETLTLDVTNSGATYLWQDNSVNATYTVTQADTFYVAVDLNGCIATDTIIVDYQGGLSPVFIGDTTICVDEEIELDATVGLATQYLWSDNSTSSTIFVNDSGEYWVEIFSLCDTLRDTIQVDFKDCACEFEAPNVFTPNGDGVNDYFYPSLKCQLVSYEMNIFNRWGDLVFYSNQPLLQWDGRVNDGKKAAEGHYMYVIEYKDVLSGQKNTEKGTFMLMY